MVIIFEPIGVRFGGMEALNVKLYMPNTTELLIYVAHLSGLHSGAVGQQHCLKVFNENYPILKF